MHKISEAHHKELKYERLQFSAKKDDGSEWEGAGWSWEIENGELQIQQYKWAGLENLLHCLLPDFITAFDWDDEKQTFVTESQAFGNGRIVKWTNRGYVPAVIQCCKNGRVHLSGFTNTCRACGADYNMSGQRLAPRHFWGEETGEHWSELMDGANNNVG